MCPMESHLSAVALRLHLTAPMNGSLNLPKKLPATWPFKQVLVGAPLHGLPAQILQCTGVLETRAGRLACC